jgi:Fur family zinc uptake transcriptional regulator
MTILVEKRLKQAEQFCLKTGVQLTSIRRQLLSLMYIQNEPISAYELLELFRKANPKAASMTVYRALDFLQTQKFIHRLASRNAYTACETPQHHRQAHFLLCETCGQAQEVDAVSFEKSARKLANEYGFVLSDKPIEIVGVCKRCHHLRADACQG